MFCNVRIPNLKFIKIPCDEKRWICEFSIWYGYELLLAILNTWMSADHCTYGSCQSSSILRIPALSFFLVQVNFIASHCNLREGVYK